MKITAQELIDELKKLPPDSEIRFKFFQRETISQDPDQIDLKFDRMVFSAKPTIELFE